MEFPVRRYSFGHSIRSSTLGQQLGTTASPVTFPESLRQGTKAFKNAQLLTPDDIVIAVMGVTGAGKTSFISLLTHEKLKIGDSLKSCTIDVGIHQCTLSGGRKVWLVDTPGFDDTYKSDTDILKEIAEWLATAYENKILLTGIIYLHRISDPRVGNSAMKNLRMFKKLVGNDGLHRVVLATTFWSKVTPEDGDKKEKELVGEEDFWGFLRNKGSTIHRHSGDRGSAENIIKSLISDRTGNPEERMVLAIQEEVVAEGKKLNETAAGQTLQNELELQRKRFEAEIQELKESLQEAIREKDRQWEEKLRITQYDVSQRLQKADPDALKVEVERSRRCTVM